MVVGVFVLFVSLFGGERERESARKCVCVCVDEVLLLLYVIILSFFLCLVCAVYMHCGLVLFMMLRCPCK